MLAKFFRKLVPPIWFLIMTLVQITLYYLAPKTFVFSKIIMLFGILLMVLGISLLMFAANQFRKVETPVRPFEQSTKIVKSGLYSLSRNPMYLGMLLMSVGSAFTLRDANTLIAPLALFIIISQGYIKEEEIFLEKLFGQSYLDYKKSVRRWF